MAARELDRELRVGEALRDGDSDYLVRPLLELGCARGLARERRYAGEELRVEVRRREALEDEQAARELLPEPLEGGLVERGGIEGSDKRFGRVERRPEDGLRVAERDEFVPLREPGRLLEVAATRDEAPVRPTRPRARRVAAAEVPPLPQRPVVALELPTGALGGCRQCGPDREPLRIGRVAQVEEKPH